MRLVKPVRDRVDEPRRERVVDWDRQRVLLRLIAHVERVLDARRVCRHTLVLKCRAPFSLERTADIGESRQVGV